MRAIAIPRSRAIRRVHTDRVLIAQNAVRDALAQRDVAALVVGVQRRVEEVAHVVDDGTGDGELGECAGAVAAERGGEGAGFD